VSPIQHHLPAKAGEHFACQPFALAQQKHSLAQTIDEIIAKANKA